MNSPKRLALLFYSIITVLISTVTCVAQSASNELFETEANGKFGLIDISGKWILKPSFDSISAVSDGYISFYQDGMMGIANGRGRTIVPPIWKWILLNGPGLAQAESGRGFTVLSLKNGRRISDFYKATSIYLEDLMAVQNSHDKWGFLDTRGRIAIPCMYDSVNDFDNGIAYASIAGKGGFINKRGQDTTSSPDYMKRMTQYDDRRFVVDGKYGMKNSRGDTIMKPVYDELSYPITEYYAFSIGGKYGIADSNGVIVCPPQYDYIKIVLSGYAVARVDCQWGYISATGKTIVPFVFEEIESLFTGYGAAKDNGKWGIIDDTGKWLVKPKFDRIRELYFMHDLRPGN